MQDPSNPYAAPAAASGPWLGASAGRTLADMRFMGWVTLVYGVLTCLTIIGAVFGVPTIIAAHRFIEGVNRFEVYRQAGRADELEAGFAELGRSFSILKVITIIYLILTVMYLVFMFFLGGVGLLSSLADS